ncbi:MAG: TraR/DksA C4-type zinc finger protein [Atribacterota bacterium]
MEDKEKSEFQKQLFDLRARIVQILKKKNSYAKEYNPLKESRDEADLGNATLDMELELSSKRTLQETLEMVEKALKRLEAGTYETCEICKRKIPLNRLRSIPYTSYCVECQAKLEHTEQ